MKKLLIIAVCALAGCTHSIHMSHLSDFSSNAPSAQQMESRLVETETEQTVFLGFVFDTDYVDEAYNNIQQACQGELTAINTQYSTSHGFLHWTNKIRVKAVCRS